MFGFGKKKESQPELVTQSLRKKSCEITIGRQSIRLMSAGKNDDGDELTTVSSDPSGVDILNIVETELRNRLVDRLSYSDGDPCHLNVFSEGERCSWSLYDDSRKSGGYHVIRDICNELASLSKDALDERERIRKGRAMIAEDRKMAMAQGMERAKRKTASYYNAAINSLAKMDVTLDEMQKENLQDAIANASDKRTR